MLLGDNVYPAGDPGRIRATVFEPFAPLLDAGTDLFAVGIALDSTRPDHPGQLAWLEETQAASDATWKLVGLHHPPYSSGFHGSHEELRHTFVPFFERYGVQVVFSGHEHDYRRSDPIDGVTYIVSGGASRTRRTGVDDFTAVAWSTHHFVDLNMFEDHLLVRAIDQDGEQFDEVVVPARPGPRG